MTTGEQRDWRAHYAAQAAAAEADAEEDYYRPPRKTPLTTNQHILHLLLTVFTCGLWLPVWIVRASQGNRA